MASMSWPSFTRIGSVCDGFFSDAGIGDRSWLLAPEDAVIAIVPAFMPSAHGT